MHYYIIRFSRLRRADNGDYTLDINVFKMKRVTQVAKQRAVKPEDLSMEVMNRLVGGESSTIKYVVSDIDNVNDLVKHLEQTNDTMLNALIDFANKTIQHTIDSEEV